MTRSFDGNVDVSITNNAHGNADFVLFYRYEGHEPDKPTIVHGKRSLRHGETADSLLSVAASDQPEGGHWALSLFVKDGPNAGSYVSQGPWLQCRLPAGSHVFTHDISTFTVSETCSTPMVKTAPRPDASMPAISHVFVVMLENRSFDHMLAFSGISGITHATTEDSNTYMIMDECRRTGVAAVEPADPVTPQTCNVIVGNPTTLTTDPGHEFPDVVMQLCGEFSSFDSAEGYPPVDNSGFLASYATSTTEAPYQTPATNADLDQIMTCFDSPTDLPVLTTLAAKFAVCDHWFSSMPGPTWPNRFFLHAASAAGFDHSPSTSDMTYWEKYEALSFPKKTIFHQLADLSIAYRFYQDYTPLWTSYYSANASSEYHYLSAPYYCAGAVPQVNAILPSSLERDFNPVTSLASDLSGPYSYPYTFIEPHYGDILGGTYQGGSSQHPMDEVYGGENMLSAIYSAISKSPYWQSSLLVICYDEHGGLYDSVPPPKCANPEDLNVKDAQWIADNQYGFDFTQLGVRVPAVLVSPLIPVGTVCTTQFDHSTVSKMLSQLFGTNTMTERDKKASSPLTESWWLTQPRIGQVPAPTPASSTSAGKTVSKEIRAALLDQPLPHSGNEIGTLFILRKMELEASPREEHPQIHLNFKKIVTRRDAQEYAHHVFKKLRGKPAKSPHPAPEREPAEPL